MGHRAGLLIFFVVVIFLRLNEINTHDEPRAIRHFRCYILFSFFQNLFYVFNLTGLCLDCNHLHKMSCITCVPLCLQVCISQGLPVKSGNWVQQIYFHVHMTIIGI